MESIFDGENGDIVSAFREAHMLTVPSDDLLDQAEELKAKGNDAFRAARFCQAAACYATALLVLEVPAPPEGSAADAAGEQPGQEVRGRESTDEVSGETSFPFTCGQRVSVRLREDSQIEAEGIICCDNDDGTYDLIMDTGDDKDAVPQAHIRPLPIETDASGDDSSRRRAIMAACLINCARCAFQVQHFSMSVALATQAIQINPSNPAFFFVRGRARLAIPLLDLAKEVFQTPSRAGRLSHHPPAYALRHILSSAISR